MVLTAALVLATDLVLADFVLAAAFVLATLFRLAHDVHALQGVAVAAGCVSTSVYHAGYGLDAEEGVVIGGVLGQRRGRAMDVYAVGSIAIRCVALQSRV